MRSPASVLKLRNAWWVEVEVHGGTASASSGVILVWRGLRASLNLDDEESHGKHFRGYDSVKF